ncbi:MAG: hypothetical protein LBT99_01275 [Bifidobacteriaceae bacterium]|jgi:hypothetical protein|nr:hypothetical protein [Bifidobacteriaceae bacterium]
MIKNIMSKVRMLVLATALVFGMLGVSAVNTNKVEAKELSEVKSVGIDRVACSTPWSLQIHSNATTCWTNVGAVSVSLYYVFGLYAGQWYGRIQLDSKHTFNFVEGQQTVFGETHFVDAIHILGSSTNN